MSRTLKRKCGTGRSGRLMGLLCAASCFLFAPVAPAQTNDQQLLVSHVSPSLTDTHQAVTSPLRTAEGAQNTALSESDSWQITTQRRELTQGEKWERFEAEFGITHKNSSFVRGVLESAKYRLDKTVFGLQEWVDAIEGVLRFDYPLTGLGNAPGGTVSSHLNDSVPFWGSLETPRLQSDIDLDPFTRRAFVGVRVVFRFGD